MKVLVIDDMRVMKPGLIEPESEITYARNSTEGLEVLREYGQSFEVICLDHDLGGVDTVKPCLDYILEFNDLFSHATFFVHTGNPYEKDSIHQQLRARGLLSTRVEATEFFYNDYRLWAVANGLQ